MIDEYNLKDIVTDKDWIYMEICKALYSLCQRDTPAANKLSVDLNLYVYNKVPKINGLWKHESCPISFSSVVNNFGIAYVERADT